MNFMRKIYKILSVVLAVLMVFSIMPIAFAVETAVKIEHQPTSGEPFVKLSDEVDATYRWRELNLGHEITAENAEPCIDGENYASYNAETGWSPVVWENGLGGNHFVISLVKGQRITLKLDGFAYTIGIWNDTLDKGDYEYNVDGGLVTLEAPATHLEEGVKTFTCTCGDTYTEVIEKTTDHTYNEVVTAPTCEDKGYTTYTCECGDSYVADYVNALGHTLANAAEENYVAPTCTENGSKDVVVYCSACDEELNRETVEIEILDHVDENNDGYCDDCDFQICDHKCHKGGFFWKLTLFFNKLFKSNKYCSCGVAHY